jgi:serine protease
MLVASVVIAGGCGGGDGSSGAVVSGAVTAPAFSHLDGDTNNPLDPLRRNDTSAAAQPLANPAAVAGYLRTAGSPGDADPQARFASSADLDDWYAVTLAAGQAVNLVIHGTEPDTDFDLFLTDAGGSVVASSVNVNDAAADRGNIETLQAPADGDFLIHIAAVQGAGNYVLRLGNGVEALRTSGLSVQGDFVPGQVIVRFHDGMAPAGRGAVTRAGLYRVPVDRPVGASAGPRAAADAGLRFASERARRKYRTIQHLKALRRNPNVRWASLNYRVTPLATTSDPKFDNQQNLAAARFPEAWTTVAAEAQRDVVVAVVDTGVVRHPDLDGNVNAADGYDFVQADGGIDADPTDPAPSGLYHGIHVAGTLAAVTDNDYLIAGAAGTTNPVRLMMVRALGANGGTEYDVLQAVRYAAGLANDSGRLPARPAEVINLSLGGGSGQLGEAFREVRDQAGVILVAAAGNAGVDSINVPAIYDGVVAVGALAPDGSRAGFSNTGEDLDVMAPGVGIPGLGLNADGSPTAFELDGTSMATPHVAAVAALMKAVWPRMTPDQFDCALLAGDLTDDLGAAGWDRDTGYGAIDAADAVAAAVAYRSGAASLEGRVIAEPRVLDFGSLLDVLTLEVSAPCDAGTTVSVSASTADGADWLSVGPPSDPRGIGEYRVRVDRTAMPPQTSARGTLTVRSSSPDVAPLEIDVVALTEPAGAFAADAGTLYVQLVGLGDSAASREQRLQTGADGGPYRFRFAAVPPGEYLLLAGTDRDYDFFVNDPGEAFGAYPEAGTIRRIRIGDDGGLGGLDFELGFRGRLDTRSGSVQRADDSPWRRRP